MTGKKVNASQSCFRSRSRSGVFRLPAACETREREMTFLSTEDAGSDKTENRRRGGLEARAREVAFHRPPSRLGQKKMKKENNVHSFKNVPRGTKEGRKKNTFSFIPALFFFFFPQLELFTSVERTSSRASARREEKKGREKRTSPALKRKLKTRKKGPLCHRQLSLLRKKKKEFP